MLAVVPPALPEHIAATIDVIVRVMPPATKPLSRWRDPVIGDEDAIVRQTVLLKGGLVKKRAGQWYTLRSQSW
jgi:hypothetical protein